MAEQAAVEEVQAGIGESIRPKPPNIRKILNGIVSLVESMEQRKYIIPQYPTYFVNLLHIKLEDNERELDAFIELKPNEQRPSIPGDIFVERGFFLQPDETCGQLGPLESVCNPVDGIFIISDWSAHETTVIDETSQEEQTDSNEEQSQPNSPLLFSSPDPDEESVPMVLHTVAFKVMGTLKMPGVQGLLQRAHDTLQSGIIVPVRIMPEPSNPVDKNAIAFQCCIDSEWHTFGYAVREVTEDIHSALHNNLIIKTEFKDIRFIFTWSKSAPGFYAAVNITKKGSWSSNVTRCASTF